jgi:hypothetical protein
MKIFPMNLSFGSPPQTRRLLNRSAELLPYVFNKWGHNAPRLRTTRSAQLDQAAVYGKWNASSNGTRFPFHGDIGSKARRSGNRAVWRRGSANSNPGLQQRCWWGMPAASIAQRLSCGNAPTGDPKFHITNSLSSAKAILNWYDHAWECESCFRREQQLKRIGPVPSRSSFARRISVPRSAQETACARQP